MKILYPLLLLTVFPLQTMENGQSGRVPPLKALAARVDVKKPKSLPQDIADYLEITKKALTFSGNAQAALWDMVTQGTLLMDEQISFLKQRDAKLDLNKRYHPQNKFGATLLMHAAQLGNTKAIAILLRNGAHINEKSLHGWTALEYATRFGQIEATRILIEAGADANLQDGFGRTALIQAVRHNQPQITRLLLEAGADQSITDQEGATALIYATLAGNQEIIKLLTPN